ncbi:MAG: sigma-70 family RNA polymerase sigma factor [Verrucomicrobiota bacterium]
MSDPDNSQNLRAGDPPPPDAVLLQRYAKQEDQLAFAELVHRHSGWVFSIAKRRSGQTDLAQECSQNVFLALARKAARLVSSPSLAPWLHRAAVLETATLLRRESRYRHAMKRHQDESALHETPLNAQETWKAMRTQVDEALNSLPGADRELLIMHHVEGRTFPEIARDLGATEAAAQRRGHRALKKLTARLRRCGVVVPATVLGAALASGMTAEAAAARPVMSGILQTVSTAGCKATAAAGGAHVFPVWVASPAMLAAIALVSAGVPVWWGTTTQAGMPAAKANLLASTGDALKASAIPAVTRPAVSTDSALSFLRQALAQLRKEPSSGEPTKLGLQLRKYMLGLTAKELDAVGRLLGEVPGYEGEFPAVLGAFSTRLAQADPVLAWSFWVQSRTRATVRTEASVSAERRSWMCCHAGRTFRRCCGFVARTKS